MASSTSSPTHLTSQSTTVLHTSYRMISSEGFGDGEAMPALAGADSTATLASEEEDDINATHGSPPHYGYLVTMAKEQSAIMGKETDFKAPPTRAITSSSPYDPFIPMTVVDGGLATPCNASVEVLFDGVEWWSSAPVNTCHSSSSQTSPPAAVAATAAAHAVTSTQSTPTSKHILMAPPPTPTPSTPTASHQACMKPPLSPSPLFDYTSARLLRTLTTSPSLTTTPDATTTSGSPTQPHASSLSKDANTSNTLVLGLGLDRLLTHLHIGPADATNPRPQGHTTTRWWLRAHPHNTHHHHLHNQFSNNGFGIGGVTPASSPSSSMHHPARLRSRSLSLIPTSTSLQKNLTKHIFKRRSMVGLDYGADVADDPDDNEGDPTTAESPVATKANYQYRKKPSFEIEDDDSATRWIRRRIGTNGAAGAAWYFGSRSGTSAGAGSNGGGGDTSLIVGPVVAKATLSGGVSPVRRAAPYSLGVMRRWSGGGGGGGGLGRGSGRSQALFFEDGVDDDDGKGSMKRASWHGPAPDSFVAQSSSSNTSATGFISLSEQQSQSPSTTTQQQQLLQQQGLSLASLGAALPRVILNPDVGTTAASEIAPAASAESLVSSPVFSNLPLPATGSPPKRTVTFSLRRQDSGSNINGVSPTSFMAFASPSISEATLTSTTSTTNTTTATTTISNNGRPPVQSSWTTASSSRTISRLPVPSRLLLSAYSLDQRGIHVHPNSHAWACQHAAALRRHGLSSTRTDTSINSCSSKVTSRYTPSSSHLLISSSAGSRNSNSQQQQQQQRILMEMERTRRWAAVSAAKEASREDRKFKWLSMRAAAMSNISKQVPASASLPDDDDVDIRGTAPTGCVSSPNKKAQQQPIQQENQQGEALMSLDDDDGREQQQQQFSHMNNNSNDTQTDVPSSSLVANVSGRGSIADGMADDLLSHNTIPSYIF